MNILWHYLFSIFQVATQYLRGFQPHGAPTTVQEKLKYQGRFYNLENYSEMVTIESARKVQIKRKEWCAVMR